MNTASGQNWRIVLIAGLLGLAATVAVVATFSRYGFAIDEATYLWVAREERAWFAQLPERGVADSLSLEDRARGFHYLEPPGTSGQPHSNFNLPVAMHLMNAGWLIGHRWLDELDSLRLASAILFGATIAMTVVVVGKEVGPIAGMASGAAIFLSPRPWGHAHLAATETALACLWTMSLLALVLQARSTTRGEVARRILLAATLVGLTYAVKLTAWVLVAPCAVWLLLYRPRRWPVGLVAILAAPVVFVIALTPTLWDHPIDGLVRYLKLAADNPWKIAAFHLGRGYEGRMPWSSGPLILAVTTPLSFLILAAMALALDFKNRVVCLIGLNLAALLALRMLGFMPTHDGERQFLPAHYFVAILAGIEASRLAALAREFHPTGRALAHGVLGLLVAAALFAEAALDAWTYRDHGLSYYNRAVGGLPGARDLGYEVTYWMEPMTDDDWRRMMGHLPRGARVFLLPHHPGLDYLKEKGLWREDVKSVGPGEADYYLLAAKQAAFLLKSPRSGMLELADDLAGRQRYGRAIDEVRFLGVRLVALLPARN